MSCKEDREHHSDIRVDIYVEYTVLPVIRYIFSHLDLEEVD
jgi:hypothetical protein